MHPSNLILVGPMGAGKTTIGRRLAKALDREFIDCDEELERRTGVSIALIFELEGEAGFRDREQRLLAELCARPGIVLATGGGVVLREANRRCLAGSGYVVYLQTSVAEQLRRVRNDGTRPLLQTSDPHARLCRFAELRNPLYRQVADLVIDTGGGYVKQVVKRILRQYEQQCR